MYAVRHIITCKDDNTVREHCTSMRDPAVKLGNSVNTFIPLTFTDNSYLLISILLDVIFLSVYYRS